MTAARPGLRDLLAVRAGAAVVATGVSVAALLFASQQFSPLPEREESRVAAALAVSEWPDASSTGVPDGVELVETGPLTITEPGAVIDGLLVRGSIEVLAADVTIRSSRIVGGVIRVGDNPDEPLGVLIEDVEIDGRGLDPAAAARMAGVGFGGVTVRRADIHDVGIGVSASFDTTVEGSWIHDLAVDGDPGRGGSHNDGILSNGGTGLRFLGNRIDAGTAPNVSGAICLYGDFAEVRDVVIVGNRLEGGGYGLYAGSIPGKAYPRASGVVVLRNAFGHSAYGPVAGWRPGRGSHWAANERVGSGRPVVP